MALWDFHLGERLEDQRMKHGYVTRERYPPETGVAFFGQGHGYGRSRADCSSAVPDEGTLPMIGKSKPEFWLQDFEVDASR